MFLCRLRRGAIVTGANLQEDLRLSAGREAETLKRAVVVEQVGLLRS